MNHALAFRDSALLCACTVLMTACLGGTRESPKKRYFALHVERPAPQASPGPQASPAAEARVDVRHDATLAVRRARVGASYEGRGLVYRRGDAEFQSDFYNEFLVSPSAQLTEEVRRTLADARVFRNVVDASSAVAADVVLETVIEELHGDFRNPSEPQAVLEAEFFLVREDSGVVLARWHHRAEIRIDRAGASELIEGWNLGLREVLSALARELDGVDLAAR